MGNFCGLPLEVFLYTCYQVSSYIALISFKVINIRLIFQAHKHKINYMYQPCKFIISNLGITAPQQVNDFFLRIKCASNSSFFNSPVIQAQTLQFDGQFPWQFELLSDEIIIEVIQLEQDQSGPVESILGYSEVCNMQHNIPQKVAIYSNRASKKICIIDCLLLKFEKLAPNSGKSQRKINNHFWQKAQDHNQLAKQIFNLNKSIQQLLTHSRVEHQEFSRYLNQSTEYLKGLQTQKEGLQQDKLQSSSKNQKQEVIRQSLLSNGPDNNQLQQIRQEHSKQNELTDKQSNQQLSQQAQLVQFPSGGLQAQEDKKEVQDLQMSQNNKAQYNQVKVKFDCPDPDKISENEQQARYQSRQSLNNEQSLQKQQIPIPKSDNEGVPIPKSDKQGQNRLLRRNFRKKTAPSIRYENYCYNQCQSSVELKYLKKKPKLVSKQFSLDILPQKQNLMIQSQKELIQDRLENPELPNPRNSFRFFNWPSSIKNISLKINSVSIKMKKSINIFARTFLRIYIKNLHQYVTESLSLSKDLYWKGNGYIFQNVPPYSELQIQVNTCIAQKMVCQGTAKLCLALFQFDQTDHNYFNHQYIRDESLQPIGQLVFGYQALKEKYKRTMSSNPGKSLFGRKQIQPTASTPKKRRKANLSRPFRAENAYKPESVKRIVPIKSAIRKKKYTGGNINAGRAAKKWSQIYISKNL